MKKAWFFVVAVIGWVALSSISFGYSGGNGISVSPYQISSVADWQTFMATTSDWGKYFILTSDISLWNVTLVPVGNPSIPFSGSFNGNGHIIRSAVINTPSNNYVGLFGYNTGQIRDFGLDEVYITGNQYVGGLVGANARAGIGSNVVGAVIHCSSTGTVTGSSGSKYIGGLIGANSGTVSHCFAAVLVTGDSNSDGTGGLAGYNQGGTIIACWSGGSVSGYTGVGGLTGVNAPTQIWTYQGWIVYPALITDSASASQVTGVSFLGGFAGVNSGTITNCYGRGQVSGSSSYIGGLVGGNSGGSINTCYSKGFVGGVSSVGGLVGTNSGGIISPGTVVDSFWDINTSGCTTSAGGTGKTTTEMKTLSTFTSAGWDFTDETVYGTNNYWRMCVNGVDYPRLNWESIDGDFACPDGVNMEDLEYFVGRWLLDNCTSGNNYCGGGDVDSSGKVDLSDFAVLAGQWLEGI
jgi:hypothetical protein